MELIMIQVGASIYETHSSKIVFRALYPSSLWLSACIASGHGQIQRLIGAGIKRVWSENIHHQHQASLGEGGCDWFTVVTVRIFFTPGLSRH